MTAESGLRTDSVRLPTQVLVAGQPSSHRYCLAAMAELPSASTMGIGSVLNDKTGGIAIKAEPPSPEQEQEQALAAVALATAASHPQFHPQLPTQLAFQSPHTAPENRSASPHGSDEHLHQAGPLSHSWPASAAAPVTLPSPSSNAPSPNISAGYASRMANAAITSVPMTGTAMPDANMGTVPLGPPAAVSPMGMSPVGGPPTTAQNLPGGPGLATAPVPKQHPCSTCGKTFARRSDLSRHERIHSGDRPHVCDFANCGKQFIQRSALTVHMRVHTGEKPHSCERCGKPFSDSSSLARHRRIHSGKRPYKCPYADCQKTFTRRTTLTRHQNHHAGTVEDSHRNTQALLARGQAPVGSSLAHQQAQQQARQQAQQQAQEAQQQALQQALQQAQPQGAQSVSNHGVSTPSPTAQRAMSMSPSIADLSGTIQNLQYLASSSIPAHLRGDVQTASPISSASTTSSAYSAGVMRPTSHPHDMASQTPEANLLKLQQATQATQQAEMGCTGGASPHEASVDSHGWATPEQGGSPAQSPNPNAYIYPDPEAYPGPPVGQMFYNSASVIAGLSQPTSQP